MILVKRFFFSFQGIKTSLETIIVVVKNHYILGTWYACV